MKPSNPYDVILSPVMTEKSTLGSEHNQVTFRVARAATKPMIKNAVEKLFGVTVTSVNTLNMKGKTKTFRGVKGRRAGYKKAMVSLADGDNIDITPGV